MTLDSRISLQKLEVFCLVVELGGVGRAARQLKVAQPVVSVHLRTLQERLGVQLLHRKGRGTGLTPAGEAVYAWAKAVLQRSQQMVRELDRLMDEEAAGAVVASSMTMGSYVLPSILGAFRREHPNARITLRMGDPGAVLREVATGVADLGVVATGDPVDEELFTVTEVAAEGLVLVSGPDDLQVPAGVGPAQLEELRYVGSPGGLTRRRILETTLEGLGVRADHIVLELGHPEAVKSAVRDGAGVALLSRSAVAQELEEGTLRAIDVDGPPMTVPVLLVRRVGRPSSSLQGELAERIRTGIVARIANAVPALGSAVPALPV